MHWRLQLTRPTDIRVPSQKSVQRIAKLVEKQSSARTVREPRVGGPTPRVPQRPLVFRHPQPLRQRSQERRRVQQGAVAEPAGRCLARPPTDQSVWWKLRKGELDKLMDEESHCSQTDLTVIRWSWLRQYPKPKLTEEDIAFEKAQPIRNHGLFSKAEKALTAAGWSESAPRLRGLSAYGYRRAAAHPAGAERTPSSRS